MVGAAATCALHVACSDDDGAAGNSMAGANAKDVAVGSLGIFSTGVVLGRDAGGLYAMTSVCTHQQCDISKDGTISAAGLNCICHGSRFGPTGLVLNGPATAPLKHFQVDVAADGKITIQTGTVVDAAVRTPV
jgi:Rieske Fe-S protein